MSIGVSQNCVPFSEMLDRNKENQWTKGFWGPFSFETHPYPTQAAGYQKSIINYPVFFKGIQSNSLISPLFCSPSLND